MVNNTNNNQSSTASVPHHSHQYANKQPEAGSLRLKLKHKRLFNLIEKPLTNEKTNLVNNSNGNTPFKKLDLLSTENDSVSTNTSNGDTHLQRFVLPFNFFVRWFK